MTRRGLTLVEVLAATVLLAAMAAACMPLMQRAMRDLEGTPPQFDLHELSEVADALVATPGVFGVEDLTGVEQAQVAWPEDAGRPIIAITRLPAGEEKPDHAWLSVTCGGWQVYRWIPIEHDEEEEQTP